MLGWYVQYKTSVPSHVPSVSDLLIASRQHQTDYALSSLDHLHENRRDTSEQMLTLPVFTSAPLFPFAPSLTSFDFRTPTIKLSRSMAAVRFHCQFNPYTSPTISPPFFLHFSTPSRLRCRTITHAFICPGHRLADSGFSVGTLCTQGVASS